MHRIFLPLVLSIALSGCCFFGAGGGASSGYMSNCCPMCDESMNVPEMSRVVITFGQKMFHRHHLSLENSYCRQDNGQIDKLVIYFSSQDVVELCDSRATLVDATETLLNMINEDDLLASRLEKTPFTYDNVDIHIVYESFHTRYVDPTYLYQTILQDGNVFYYSGMIENINTQAWLQRVEPYYKTREFAYFLEDAETPYIEEELRRKEEEKSQKSFDERFNS